MEQSTINLLRPTEKESTQVSAIKGEARRFTFIAFLICVTLGVLVLSVSTILTFSFRKTQSDNTSLKKQIEEYKEIESKLSVVKTRTSVIEKALEYSKPLDTQITYINAIEQPPVLQSFAIDETDTVTVTLKPDSIEETMTMVGILIDQANEKQIKNPRIMSYGINKDGMRIVFSFAPMWESL